MKKMLDMMSEQAPMAADHEDKKMQARKDVLEELLRMAEDGETQGLMHGLKKLTIAAPDAEGLKKGLQKAEEMMGIKEGSPEDQPSPDMGDASISMGDEEEEEEDGAE